MMTTHTSAFSIQYSVQITLNNRYWDTPDECRSAFVLDRNHMERLVATMTGTLMAVYDREGVDNRMLGKVPVEGKQEVMELSSMGSPNSEINC